MRTTSDSPKLDVVGTAGLSSASQLLNVTGLPAASSGMDLTATPEPLRLRPRFALRTTSRSVVSETIWRQLANTERKKAKKRGFKPADVTKAVEANRYRR